MIDVVSISFKEKGKTYYFSPNKLNLKDNMNVIVETERGLQFGTVVGNITKIKESQLNSPLKPVVRIAYDKDVEQNNKNIKEASKAVNKCRDLVKKYNLNMKIIDASYTFDREQLLFRFLSDNRVDFRELAKELASIYKTRIELRQVGVRDKAREVGGIGPCGRPFCCSKFLNEFDSVSINMAKNQNIALNPNKINGVCGRLLCCLKYEDECYKEYKKDLPNIGSKIKLDDTEGIVSSVNILEGKFQITLPNGTVVEKNKNDKN